MALYSGVREKEMQVQIASVALAIESLETLLIEKGVLKDNEVMNRAMKLAKAKMLGVNRLADDYVEVHD